MLFYISNQVTWFLEAHRRRLIGFQHFEFGSDEILECDREDKNIDLLGSEIGLKYNASQKERTLPVLNSPIRSDLWAKHVSAFLNIFDTRWTLLRTFQLRNRYLELFLYILGDK